MKLWKTVYPLLLVISTCFALFSSCGVSTTSFRGTPTPNAQIQTAMSAALLTPQPTSSPNGCTYWNTATSILNGVSFVSTNDAWTVGSYGSNQCGSLSSLTLVEHWNGTQWIVVASPNITGSTANELLGIAAIAANDIWAVGDATIEKFSLTTQQALIEHWNGTVWSIVENPSIASKSTTLRAVSAISATDAWAIGAGAAGPLIIHWNGTTWSRVTSPAGPHDTLSNVTAISATDAWAIGAGVAGPLIIHWNGTTWSRVTSPAGPHDTLSGVTAVSVTDIWAVGTGISSYGWQTLIEHWNGTQWTVIARGSRSGVFTDDLYGVSASSMNDVWAVGTAYRPTPSSGYNSLIEHWDGFQWNVVKLPPMEYTTGLNSIAVVSASNIWAVGNYARGPGEPAPTFTLIEHWNGSTWSVVNSPSPSYIR